MGPVVDYALTVPEVDPAKIIHFGYSLGGYLVSRYAAHDHRSAALVCNDGMTTFYASYPPIPTNLKLIEEGRDDEALPLLEAMIKGDTNARWGLQNGVWVNGVAHYAEYVRSTRDYTLTGQDIASIQTPVLLLEGEDDEVSPGRLRRSPRGLRLLRACRDAQRRRCRPHCHEGGGAFAAPNGVQLSCQDPALDATGLSPLHQ